MLDALDRNPNRCFLRFVTLLLAMCASEQSSATDFEETSRATAIVIQKHCLKCHGADQDIQGDVNLAGIRDNKLADNLDLLGSLIEVLDRREMPPEGEPQLPDTLRVKLVDDLRIVLHEAIRERKRFSHTPIRRMNRFQYNNAVVDLFDLRCTVFTLPERMMRDHKGYFKPESGAMADNVTVGSRPLGKSQMIEPRLSGVAAFPQDLRAEHGYDNRGDHLSMSPLLMESFLKLSQSITESPDFEQRRVGIWKTFFAEPNPTTDPKVETRRRLGPFLRKAFRRPVNADLIERYASYVESQLDLQVSFTDAMKSAAAAVIASPKFLYLYEKSTLPTATAADDTQDSITNDALGSERSDKLDDFELASRLSFFLWGSVPDNTLLDLAESGKLREPDVLDAQVDRMLRDAKLKRFCDSFPSQWLQLERIISSVPNREKFPGFYFSKYRASMHMMLEPLLLFETILIEDRPITELLDSEFTYRSRTLEDAYGVLGHDPTPEAKRGSGVTVLNFERVAIKDRRNGGVITCAAVMTMTSGPERTQPITRGAWVAGVIFNDPPEPPPADVPALGEKPPAGQEHLTLRERLAMHRKRSDCKGCHEQIDPLGFALENYDAVGRWRETYDNDRDIDMAGTLFRKHKFNDIVEFKDALLAEKDRFTRGFAGHVLSYALARELGIADQIALDQIAKATAASDYRFKTLIKQVIHSEPFLSKSIQAATKTH